MNDEGAKIVFLFDDYFLCLDFVFVDNAEDFPLPNVDGKRPYFSINTQSLHLSNTSSTFSS